MQQYKKLPRHFTAYQTFQLDLSKQQAATLNYLLPKGCSIVQQPINKIKPTHPAKSKQLQENIYSSSHHHYNKQSSHHQIPPVSTTKTHHHHTTQNKQSSLSTTKQPTTTSNLTHNKPVTKKPIKQQLPEIVKPCISILQQLKAYKHSWPFLQPVDADALGIPEYYQIIAQPMDLATVQYKLKLAAYKTPQQFYRDINLMIRNSYVFNQANQQFVKITNDFEKYFWRLAGPESKPSNDKKLQKQKEKQRQRLQRERAKEEKLKQKMLQKQKQRQRKLLLQQQQQAQQALKMAKKKKKLIPKDILQAQNISVEQKQQLANNIHNLSKQHLKGIRNIVFSDIKQQDITNNLNINSQFRTMSTNQFDIQKIGYKKIRELQKYVRVKLSEIQSKKYTDQLVEKNNDIDLDMMESECSEEFVI